MTSLEPARLARRHWCTLRDNTSAGLGFRHTQGPGAPRRKTCQECGSRSFVVEEGLWGVVPWTGRGVYLAENVLSWHRGKDVATKAADREVRTGGYPPHPGGYVVRWIPKDFLPESLGKAASPGL